MKNTNAIGKLLSFSSSSFVSRKIVIPIDFSESSERGLRWYLDSFLKKHNEQIILITVLKPKVSSMNGLFLPSPLLTETQIIDHWINNCLLKAYEYLDCLSKENLEASLLVYIDTNICDKLTSVINQIQPDLVIIGNRPRKMSSGGYHYFGSVSKYLVHHCHCAVCVVPQWEPN